jgi:hypothetical protein
MKCLRRILKPLRGGAFSSRERVLKPPVVSRRSTGRKVASAIFALVVTLGGLAAARAAAAPAGQTIAPGPELSQLKQRVERRYNVIRLRQGIVLVPRYEPKSVNNIEISNGLVLIDGTPVTGRELRGRLPDDADAIAQLSFLTDEARLKLFAPPAPTSSPAPEPLTVPELPVAPKPPPLESPRSRDDAPDIRETRGGARVRIGGDVVVGEHETVGDAVVVVLGQARIEGRVRGDVVAVGGGVRLGPNSQVGGSVTSVGGDIERADGARVGGEVNEVRVTFPHMGPLVRFSPLHMESWLWWPFSAADRLVATLLRLAVVGLFAAMVVLVAPFPVRRVSERVASEPLKAGVVGLAAQLLFVPLLVLTVVILVVSIVGIPLLVLIPVAVVVLLLAFLLGFTGAGFALGEIVSRRFGTSRGSMLAALAVGLALVWGLTVVARFAGMAGTPARALFSVVLLAGFVVEYVAWTVGLGGVLLSRFGRRGSPSPPIGTRSALSEDPPRQGPALDGL